MSSVGLQLSRLGAVRAFTPERLRRVGDDLRTFFPMPGRVFTDVEGAVAAAPGQTIAALRDLRGQIVATQATTAARPTYGRHPVGGIRNRVPNNRMDGAVPGTLGAGGAAPTLWDVIGTNAANVEVVGTGVSQGLNYIDVRFTGTPNTSMRVRFAGNTTIPAVAGQVWTQSYGVALVGGTLDNVNDLTVEIEWRGAAGAPIEGTFGGTNFKDSVTGEIQRFSHTPAPAIANTAFVSPRVRVGWTSGAVDFTLRISAPQIELAAEASAVQVTGASGFDVVEAGQRSVYYLRHDGVDDWIEFGTTFAPAGAYTLAAAVDRAPGLAQEIFGGGAQIDSRFAIATGNSFILQSNSSANRRQYFNALVSGRGVLLARVSDAATAKLWSNNVDQGAADVIDGVISPVSGLRALFRSSSTYGAGRFYGGVVIDRAITEPERRQLQLYLASKGGIAL